MRLHQKSAYVWSGSGAVRHLTKLNGGSTNRDRKYLHRADVTGLYLQVPAGRTVGLGRARKVRQQVLRGRQRDAIDGQTLDSNGTVRG